ncbi:glycosyltransferase [Paraburkholderia sediminicola]|uniref:glycosyltransferase family 2 protein n=1 Tax=Paraburkholderia sediminicola TaxID=458836 RepID=UPI000EB058CB
MAPRTTAMRAELRLIKGAPSDGAPRSAETPATSSNADARGQVAIIIPTKNRRVLLERALASVFRQTYTNIAAIVVNDGSTDDTRQFLDALAAREPRLTVFHTEKSMGAPSARNLAIRLANAQYVTGLDDDDEFLPDRIALLVAKWESLGDAAQSISCLFTESVMTDGVNATVTVDRKDSVSYADLFTHNFIGNQIFCPLERILKIGGYDKDLPAWQDLEMFMRLLQSHGAALREKDATYVCYVDPRRDRISANTHSLRRAFELISNKHRDVPRHLHHHLYMQIFSPFYGTRPTFGDWLRLFKWRASPALFLRVLRANIRHSALSVLSAIRA